MELQTEPVGATPFAQTDGVGTVTSARVGVTAGVLVAIATGVAVGVDTGVEVGLTMEAGGEGDEVTAGEVAVGEVAAVVEDGVTVGVATAAGEGDTTGEVAAGELTVGDGEAAGVTVGELAVGEGEATWLIPIAGDAGVAVGVAVAAGEKGTAAGDVATGLLLTAGAGEGALVGHLATHSPATMAL